MSDKDNKNINSSSRKNNPVLSISSINDGLGKFSLKSPNFSSSMTDKSTINLK